MLGIQIQKVVPLKPTEAFWITPGVIHRITPGLQKKPTACLLEQKKCKQPKSPQIGQLVNKRVCVIPASTPPYRSSDGNQHGGGTGCPAQLLRPALRTQPST